MQTLGQGLILIDGVGWRAGGQRAGEEPGAGGTQRAGRSDLSLHGYGGRSFGGGPCSLCSMPVTPISLSATCPAVRISNVTLAIWWCACALRDGPRRRPVLAGCCRASRRAATDPAAGGARSPCHGGSRWSRLWRGSLSWGLRPVVHGRSGSSSSSTRTPSMPSPYSPPPQLRSPLFPLRHTPRASSCSSRPSVSHHRAPSRRLALSCGANRAAG